MTLFLRLILKILSAIPSKRSIEQLDVASTTFRPWVLDLIRRSDMSMGRLASFTDIAMIDFMIKTGLFMDLRSVKLTPMIASKEVDVYKPIRLREKVRVTSQLVSWNGQFSVIDHYFYVGDDLRLKSKTYGRFVARHHPHPTVDEVIARFDYGMGPSPQMEPSSKVVVDSLELQRKRKRAAYEQSQSGAAA